MLILHLHSQNKDNRANMALVQDMLHTQRNQQLQHTERLVE